MNSIILSSVCVALLSSTILCRGTTTFNSEQKEFQLVQGAILQFQKATNEFPTSWDDLWNNPVSRPSVESLDQGKLFGRRTDMIESFRFIAPGTRILLPHNQSRIVGMMTRPMRPPPEEKRRLLIVQTKDGKRGIETLSEAALSKLFSRAGFDLDDYTGPNGNWAPETRLRPLSEIPPPPKSAPLDPLMDHNTIPPLPISKMLSPERKRQLRIGGSLAAVLLIAFFAWKLIATRRKKHLGKHL